MPARAPASFLNTARKALEMGIAMAVHHFENPYGFKTDDFVRPGQITLAPEAFAEARQFLSELEQYEQGTKWIVGFTWSRARTMQRDHDSRSVDEGPGIDVMGYRSTEIPSEAVEVREGVPLTFIIPREQFDRAQKKEIVETRLVSGRLSYELR